MKRRSVICRDLPLPVDGEVRDVLVHGFFFQLLDLFLLLFSNFLDLLLLIFSDLLLDAIKNLLMLDRKLLNIRPPDIGRIYFTRFRNTGHGNRFISSFPQRSRQNMLAQN